MIGFLTLVFITAIIILFINSRSARSFDDIRNLYEDEIFQKTGSYYVYVYSKIDEKADLDKAEELEELIVTYMTYAKRNSDAQRIYGMNADSYRNKSAVQENATTSVVNKTRFADLVIGKEDIPILMLIENNRVKSVYKTEKEIREVLENAMNP
jgi:hypothetical protein